MPDESYNGWANWDTWNTNLIMDNDEALQRNKEAWKLNFLRKYKKGDFDIDKAAKAILLYVVTAARKKDKEWSGDTSEIDPKKVNAKEIAQNWLDEAVENERYQLQQHPKPIVIKAVKNRRVKSATRRKTDTAPRLTAR